MIERHDVDRDHAAKQVDVLTGQVDFWIDQIEEHPETLYNVHARAMSIGQYQCVVDPAGAREWFRLAGQALAAMFTGARSPGEQVEAVVRRPVRFTGPGPTTRTNAGLWRSAAWLAVIDRDNERVGRVCDVGSDTLRAAGVHHDAFMYPWVDSVRAFLRREEVPPDVFVHAIDGSDPDQARITPKDAMLRIVSPPIVMFYQLLRRDADKFNAALEQALVQHRKYWTRHEADGPDGFVALEPLGIAVLALGVGMPVTVTSDYLPEPLLRVS